MGIDEAEYKFLAGQNNVFRGSLNEQRLRFYNAALGTNYYSVNEAEMAFLKNKSGSNANSRADLWRTYLRSLGVGNSFSIQEMRQAFYEGSFYSGSSGYSLNFDATPEYITVPSSTSINFTTTASYTWMGWWKVTAVGSAVWKPVNFVTKGVGGTRGYKLAIDSGGFILQESKGFNSLTANNPVLDGSGNILIPGWFHWACTYNGTSQIVKFYINGDLQGTPTNASFWTNVTSDTTSNMLINTSVANEASTGFVDDFFFLTSELSLSQIRDAYHSKTYPTTSLGIRYYFTDGTGTTVTDSSGNGNNGTITGAAWSTDVPATPTPFTPTDIAGLRLWLKSESLDSLTDGDAISTWTDSSGNSFSATSSGSNRPLKQTLSGKSVARFDGVNDVMSNSGMTAIGTGDYTAYLIVNVSNNNTMLGIGNGASSNVLISRVSGNLYINPQGSGTNVTDGAITASTTQLIRVYEASGTVFAQRYGATEASGALTTSTDAGYVLGDYSSSGGIQPIQGDIAEVILYDSSLSTTNKNKVESYLLAKYGL